MLSPEAVTDWLAARPARRFPDQESVIVAMERVLSRFACGDLPSFARIALARSGFPSPEIEHFAAEAAGRVRLRRALRIPPAPKD